MDVTSPICGSPPLSEIRTDLGRVSRARIALRKDCKLGLASVDIMWYAPIMERCESDRGKHLINQVRDNLSDEVRARFAEIKEVLGFVEPKSSSRVGRGTRSSRGTDDRRARGGAG